MPHRLAKPHPLTPRSPLATTQPTVIDGKLQHPVDPDACDWHLEGKGEERKLVIDLEKVSGGLDWDELLQLGSGQVV